MRRLRRRTSSTSQDSNLVGKMPGIGGGQGGLCC